MNLRDEAKAVGFWVGLAIGVGLTIAMALILSWFTLSVAQKWDFGLRMLMLLGAAGAFGWTVTQWILSRKIDFEIDILENIQKTKAVWLRIDGIMSEFGGLDRSTKLQLDERLENLTEHRDAVINGSLSFSDLRKLNKNVFAKSRTEVLDAMLRNMRVGLSERRSSGQITENSYNDSMDALRTFEGEWKARVQN